MIEAVWGNRWMMLASVLLALLLAVYPLPGVGPWMRPEFVVLLAIYWVMVLPQAAGPGLIWLVGLFQDVVEGAVLGQHAFALVVIAYICQLSYQRLRNYALWQQAGLVFVLVGIHQLLGNWVYSLSGGTSKSLLFLLPAFTSALCWPLLVVGMNRLRFHYRLL